MRTLRGLVPLLCLLVLVACQDGARDQLQSQMMLMQERLVELETQLADAQAHSSRLAPAVAELELQLRDVEAAVIDLSAYVQRDLLLDAEATLGNAKVKLNEVRARTDALGAALRSDEGEEYP